MWIAELLVVLFFIWLGAHMGSIGKYVLDHPFIIPGVITITLSVVIAFLIGPLVI